MPNIRSVSRVTLFSVFGLSGNPILNWLLNFPACFATVADRSAMHGHMGAWELESQLWAAEFLQPAEIEQGSKDYESAAEGWECYL